MPLGPFGCFLYATVGVAGFLVWIHLKTDHVDAQAAKKIEGAVQLRSIEHLTVQQRPGRHVFLLDPGKAIAEVLAQPSLHPNAEAPATRMPILVLLNHAMSVAQERVVRHPPIGQTPGVTSGEIEVGGSLQCCRP